MMEERISKSEQKRRFKREEGVAVELAQLSDNDLKILPAGEELKSAILACRSLKTGAKKRQIKYVAKVMREKEATDEILEFLAAKKGSRVKENRLLHEAERLRDLLINETLQFQEKAQQKREPLEMEWPGKELALIVQRFALNEGELRRALYQYARTRVQNYYREVFRIMKTALEKEVRGL